MLEIDIPYGESLRLDHLVTDFNGTLAVDGALLPGVAGLLDELAGRLAIHVLTGDTFGTAARALDGLPADLVVVPAERQGEAKLRYVEALGAARCVCLGNGRNDRLMCKAAALSMVVVQGEGAAVESLLAATLAVPDIQTALQLLLHPRRLTATLRT